MDVFSSCFVKVDILIAICFIQGYHSAGSPFNCSCYTFHNESLLWSESRQPCRTQGGDLVSIETVGEWEYINTQIQNRTSHENEWWIGLEKRNGEWTWLSNHFLTYNKWENGKPEDIEQKKQVRMSKDYPAGTYGLFANVVDYIRRGTICEYKNQECIRSHVIWCSQTNSTTNTMTTRSTDLTKETTTEATEAIVTTLETIFRTTRKPSTDQTTRKPSTDQTTRIYPTLSNKTLRNESPPSENYPDPTKPPNNEQEPHQESTSPTINRTTTPVNEVQRNNPFLTLIVVIVLAVLVGFFLCCAVFSVCRLKLRQKGRQKLKRERNEETDMEQNTSDVMTGTSCGISMRRELKPIHIQPDNACVQDDFTTKDILGDKNVFKEDVTKSTNGNRDVAETESSKSLIKYPQEHMDPTPEYPTVKETSEESVIYATVDKTKKQNKNTEVVYAEVNNSMRNTADQPQDLVTYAELEYINHDATRKTIKAPPPYHPTEYASVSAMPIRSQTK